MAVVVQNKLRFFYLAITLYVFMIAYSAGDGDFRQGSFYLKSYPKTRMFKFVCLLSFAGF